MDPQQPKKDVIQEDVRVIQDNLAASASTSDHVTPPSESSGMVTSAATTYWSPTIPSIVFWGLALSMVALVVNVLTIILFGNEAEPSLHESAIAILVQVIWALSLTRLLCTAEQASI